MYEESFYLEIEERRGNVKQTFGKWNDDMHAAIAKSCERYYDMEKIGGASQYLDSYLYYIQLFLQERPAYMEKYMDECFGEEEQGIKFFLFLYIFSFHFHKIVLI